MTFTALRAEERDGSIALAVREHEIADLPPGEVLIRVHYSSLNYKDLLSASGHRGITRAYPHTPGIDAAGVVEHSDHASVAPGDAVLVTGHDLGMNTWGGFSQYIRVPADWVVQRPAGLTLEQCMTIGTAGFTAAQCACRFQDNGLQPGAGPVLVTGATGGVGSVAVVLLSHLGYEVVAATRNPDNAAFLRDLGAAGIVDSAELIDDSAKPMLRARWAGAVETVGGPLLATAIRSTHRRAVITFCGMIAGAELTTSVFPFILRGLRLIGIDSAECPIAEKRALWARLGDAWRPPRLDALRTTEPFTAIPDQLARLERGDTRGRVVFRID